MRGERESAQTSSKATSITRLMLMNNYQNAAIGTTPLLESQEPLANAPQLLQFLVGLFLAAVVVVLLLDPLPEEGADVAEQFGVGDLPEVDALLLAGLLDELLEVLGNVLALVHQVQSPPYLLCAAPENVSCLFTLSPNVQQSLLAILFLNGLCVDLFIFVLELRVV